MILNFNTGYFSYKLGMWVVNRRQIMCQYIKSWYNKWRVCDMYTCTVVTCVHPPDNPPFLFFPCLSCASPRWVLDCFSIIPFELAPYIFEGLQNGNAESLKYIRMIRLLRLAKVSTHACVGYEH